MNGFAISITILATIVLIPILFLTLRPRFIRVPQEERIVIYRLGRFSCVAGPGIVKIIQGVDTHERTIYVRDQQLNFTIGDLFIHGTPFGYRLNLWCRYDIQEAAGGDQEKLKEFAQFDDNERYQATRVKIQEALRESIQVYETRHPLPRGATFVDQVLPMLPGTPDNQEILDDVRRRLVRMLPTAGVILNTTHSINIVGLILNDQIVNDFQRGRTIALFREQLPDLPIDILIQMLASIEGIESPQIERLLLDHRTNDDATGSARIDVRRSSDGRRDVRIRLPSQPDAPDKDTGANEKNESASSPEQGQAKPADIYRITSEDAAVLKPVPSRRPGNQRRSA